MQKLINYTDFFQFYLHIPLIIDEDLNDEEILQYCIDLDSFPVTVIRDKNHFLFKKINKDLASIGKEQEIKLIVLTVGYNIPYLS